MNRYGDLETMMMKVMTDKKYGAEIARKFLPNNQKQSNKNDYHMWCVDKNGNIRDDYANLNKDLKLIYKEWKQTPKHLEEKIKRYHTYYSMKDKKELVESLKTLSNIEGLCLHQSIIKNILFNYKMVIGSMANVLDDGYEFWEYGNGLDFPDYM